MRGTLALLASLTLVLLLSGCSVEDWIETFNLRSLVTFFTAGSVAAYERNLMLFTFTVMLFVLVPVIGFTFWFAWHYRASNREASYRPNWHQSHFLEGFLWGGPLVIIVILGTLTWVTTHDLDPYKPIESEHEPIRVQAIAMDWKWLFIYPDHDIAVVNEMAMPVDVPVQIRLTSATVMNAFMIPRLGSQIYAMSGMRTQLHLMATQEGSYFGKNYQYSGDGFAYMNFQALATPRAEFDRWIEKAKASGRALDIDAYRQLVAPSKKNSVSYYASVRPHLFEHVIEEFNSADGNAYHAGRAASAGH